ncbi:hypothetical protein [Bosea sp. BIWAKO-01]|uniref:hypothetical protein n=1 Tax=Bosea sp. BIWAKO-01 TaxID=506668 RepID=UPI0008531539|nr:hypothetical protein [Bosea sp. BIWAKO-01]GAU80556.1 hypothetical protein BIWAKO_00443 [Bosea sp. BIWAKO-01]
MRHHLKLKSLLMLLALLASVVAPLPSLGTAEAQVRSSGSRQMSGQTARRGHHSSAQRPQRGNRAHVSRPQHRPHTRPSHVHRPSPHVRHHRPGRVTVVHPRRHWHRGGAVAAGAALGFIAGAAAVSLAGPAPRAGYCWYYTTPQRTTGFWDWCPR